MLSAKQLNPIRLAFLRHRKLLIRNPIHAAGLLIMKTAESIAVFIGLLFYWGNHSRGYPPAHKCNTNSLSYAKRSVELRKIRLITRYIPYVNYILDLGCGSGLYIPYLKKKTESVIGLDRSITLLKMTKKLGIDVVMGDATRLPFRSDAFDVVWASEVIEHTPSLSVFGEVERIAKKFVIATMPNPYSFNYKADPTHIMRYTLASLRNYLEDRSAWKYVVRGLGVELPAFKLPRLVKLAVSTLTCALTFHVPILAHTIAVIGLRRGN